MQKQCLERIRAQTYINRMLLFCNPGFRNFTIQWFSNFGAHKPYKYNAFHSLRWIRYPAVGPVWGGLNIAFPMEIQAFWSRYRFSLIKTMLSIASVGLDTFLLDQSGEV